MMPASHDRILEFSCARFHRHHAVAAILILHQAVSAFLDPVPIDAPWIGLAVNGAASVLNAVWAFVLMRTGRRRRSPALVADGRHLATDVVSSAGVIAGLALSVLTGWTVLDPLLASAVAVTVLWSGWTLLSESVGGLMDVINRAGAFVVWIGLPQTRSAAQTQRFDVVNAVVEKEARKRPGRATYIDTYTMFAGDEGGYTQYLPDGSGQLRKVRADDGVHFEREGGDMIARVVLKALNKQFDLTSWRKKQSGA